VATRRFAREVPVEIGLLLSPLVALLGVWLGGLLTARTQERAWRQEESRRWCDTRLATYGEFVATIRDFRTWVLRPDARIDALRHPDGLRVVPSFGSDDSPAYQRIESSLAQVKMVAADQRTVDAALHHMRIARRFAVARSIYGITDIPAKLWVRLFSTELEFVNSARAELGLSTVDSRVYPQQIIDPVAGAELVDLDRILWDAHAARFPAPTDQRVHPAAPTEPTPPPAR
jgi:hypothetical protein